MGKETARELARMGAQVIVACRNRERGEAAAKEIAETTGRTGLTTMEVDLSSLASVRAFANAFYERFAKLDVLVNNAAASLPKGSSGTGQRTCSALTCSRTSCFRLSKPAATAGS
jgi:NAD(P)-dependent dehydrogenase (short-subunit alcohol dehydrogenase family)